MLTAYLTKDGFDLREREIPVCHDNDVLIQTAACGICEGDVFLYTNRKELSESVPMGHEGGGVVREVGKSVKNVFVGDQVTSIKGLAYAEYFTCRGDFVVKVPDNLDLSYAIGEAISCFVHASRRFGIRKGDRVAVIGCGYMGMGCVQMASILGAGEIHAVEPIQWRRNTALLHGATHEYDPTGKTPGRILEELGEFDVVIEAAGVASVIDLCTVLVKQHGRIVLVGYHQSDNGMRNVDMKTWNYKAIDVINGHVRRHDEKTQAMAEGLALLSENKLDFRGMIETYPLRNIRKAFDDLIGRKPGLYKAVLTF
ncbi:MAG: zinc-binding dehydrogenase [Phycisphaerae bacterium]|nr:zinc-binding dehydrogenase [Phycisphaerae bacterium]